MRPVKLKIKGLNSFVQEQIIDFEELMQNGFFGIFGPTGSGKSTILDGMILALYGMKALSRGVNEFINKNSNSACVSFEFQIRGKKVKRYLVEREYKAAAGGTKAGKCRLVDMTDGAVVLEESVKGVDRACAKILGLGADDFMRTVVLPQGKFSEFLRVSGRDRREILERLFRLEAYGKQLEDKISQALRVQLEVKENLKGQMEAYGLASEELLKERKREQKEALLQCEALDADYKVQAKKAAESEKVLKLLEEQKHFEELVRESLEALPGIKEMEVALKSAERVKGILPIHKAYEELKIQNTVLKSHVAQLEEDYIRAQEDYKKADTDYSRAALKKEQEEQTVRRNLQNGEDALQMWTAIPEMEKKAGQLENHLKNLEKKSCELICLQKETEQEAAGTRERIVQAEQTMRAQTVTMELREAVESGVRKQEEVEKIKQEYQNGAQKTEKTAMQILTMEKARNERKIQIEKLAEQKKILTEELGQLQMDNEKKQIQRLRLELTEGSPCPVCGSSHHEYRPDLHDQSLAEETIKDSIFAGEQYEELEKRFKDCESKLNELQATAKSEAAVGQILKEQAEEEAVNLKCIKEQLQVLERELWHEKKCWETEDFQLDKKQILKKDRERVQVETALDNLRKNWDVLEEKIKQYREISAGVNDQIQQTKLSLFPLKNQLNEAWKRIEEKTEPQIEPADYVKKQKRLLEHLLEEYKTGADKRECAQKAVQQILDKINQSEGQLKGNQSALEQTQEHLNSEIKQRGFQSMNEVEKCVLSDKRYTQTEIEIEEYYQHLNEYRLKCAQAEEKRAGQTVTNQEVLECQNCVIRLEKELNQQKELLGELKQQIKNLDMNLKKQKILTVELEKAEHQISMLEDIKNVTRGRRFVEFMAAKRLRYIAKSASKRLAEITNGNYELETNDEGEFIIRDNKNGGSLRTPGTLSGGETFVTSLALALALSGEIQLKGTAPLELFFLDEGFGALDENLLDVVMTSLEKIQNTNLKVGIISHVESVKARVPIRLIVTPSEAGISGSRIHVEYS